MRCGPCLLFRRSTCERDIAVLCPERRPAPESTDGLHQGLTGRQRHAANSAPLLLAWALLALLEDRSGERVADVHRGSAGVCAAGTSSVMTLTQTPTRFDAAAAKRRREP